MKGKKIAIIATDGFEQSELEKPKAFLEQEGAETHVISLKSGSIKGWDEKDWGNSVAVDKTIDQARPADYDALVLPGGQINPDVLRLQEPVLQFIREVVEAGKPVAAICHAPWLLVEAGVVRGKRVTSWPSVKTDLKNAGGQWVDESVVVDGNLITSRNPQDIPNFNQKIKEALS